jgi:hypothetical protein
MGASHGYVLIVDVIGPAIEVLGYILVLVLWALGALSNDYLFAFLALMFVYGIFVSVGPSVGGNRGAALSQGEGPSGADLYGHRGELRLSPNQ